MNDTKEQILLAALELFAREGYEGTSISMIADALGLSKGALYRHYEGKQAILQAILRRMEEGDASQAQAHALPQAAQPQAPADYARARLEDVLSFTRAMFAYWTQQPFPCAFRRMLTLEQFRSPDIGRLYQQYLGSGPVGYLRDLFASMRPGIPDERAQSLAVALFAPLHLLFALTDGGMPSCRAEALLARQLTAFRQVYEQEEIYAISQERSL